MSIIDENKKHFSEIVKLSPVLQLFPPGNIQAGIGHAINFIHLDRQYTADPYQFAARVEMRPRHIETIASAH